MKYIEYIEVPSNTRVGWDTGYVINSLDDEIFIDFMPLSGKGTDDVWYCYVSDENNIYFRSPNNVPNTKIGASFGGYRNYIDGQTTVLANIGERNEMHICKSSLQNLTSGTSIAFNAGALYSTSNSIKLNFERIKNGVPDRCMTARYYEFKVVNGNTIKVHLKPCLDENDTPCFYDEVNQTYVYHLGSGTPIAGPVITTCVNLLFIGDSNVEAMHIGSQEVEKIYIGTEVVYSPVIDYVDWIFTTNPTNSSDYRDGIEIGDVWSADAEFRIKGTMQGYSTTNGVLTNYDGKAYASTRWFWTGGYMFYDMNGERIYTSFTPTSGVNFDYTISNWGIYNNLTSSYVMSGTPKSSIEAGVVWLNMRTCKISSIEVKQGNTVVFDGKAAIDDSTGNIGLYDSVSRTLFYNPNLSMTYGE